MEGKQQVKEEQPSEKLHQPPNISPMVAVQEEAYGGGLYGKDIQVQVDDDDDDDDDDKTNNKQPPTEKPRASDTQSADGPVEATTQPKHKPPPSTGDRDTDITGQSYIQ